MNSTHQWILSRGDKDQQGGRPCVGKILKLQQSHPTSGSLTVVGPQHPPSQTLSQGTLVTSLVRPKGALLMVEF